VEPDAVYGGDLDGTAYDIPHFLDFAVQFFVE